MSDLDKHILNLYKLPFTFDGRCYIWDANKNMVADFLDDTNEFRVRGWGWIQKIGENPGELFDAAEVYIKNIVGERTEPEEIVAALNDHWQECIASRCSAVHS